MTALPADHPCRQLKDVAASVACEAASEWYDNDVFFNGGARNSSGAATA
jgi:hypothetical protein